MLNITIDCNKTIVENPDYHVDNIWRPLRWTLKTAHFFGDVYATLEKDFPDFDQDKIGDYIVAHVLNGLSGGGDDNSVKIFGCCEIGASYYALITFIDSKAVLAPTLKDVENMRIEYRMTANYLPASITEKDSMRFEGLKTVTQVMIASLYYYAYNEYKLVRCKHCGKWFATKSLKSLYCNRVSPCYGRIVGGKVPLQCEQAVRNIMQKCGRIKNRIETKVAEARRGGDNSYLYHFATECDPYYIKAKNSPSVENLEKYYNFLRETETKKEWLSGREVLKNG